MAKTWLAHYPEEVPSSFAYPQENLASFLVHSAQSFPNNPAIWFFGRTMSYRELLDASCRFANAVRAFPLAKGERLAIMLPNCPQAVIAYYGALLAGLVVVQHNPMYTERELKHQLQDCGAKALVTLDELWPKVQHIQRETDVEHVIVASVRDYLPPTAALAESTSQAWDIGGSAQAQQGVIAWNELLMQGTSDVPEIEIDATEDIALIQYTGGTTGVPKGAMLTHLNLVANTIQSALWSYQLRDGQERYLGALPFFHVFGMTVLMNQAMYKAGMLILVPRFQAKDVLRLIHEFKPTVFPGTPTMYIALMNHPDVAQYDLSSIEVCVSGAAPLPLEVQAQFERLTGGKLVEGYGLTEASPITHANNFWGERKNGSIGIPFPDTEARIVDENGNDVPMGEIGELVVRGPQVMKGYWQKLAETASVLRDGWLFTGDIGKMDEDGFFYIVDRKKDVIIAGGYNIYPREIEEVLYEHPAVAEAAVVGVTDSYRGQTVKAFIQLKQGQQVTAAEMDAWCRANLAAYKVPRAYEFREFLPKSAVGKILRRELVEDSKQNA
ncbi:long-chain-fatty-acid--CoA ligase [Alicyclobacillus sacchari]|uniref:long-chain-fatty-acid--CoA ligase n=1 Tax=Alicyclobacillus sacchari TaxID=392010 RepID=UPI0023EA00A4|nr:long-chain fatty acid--CoA ligase [Alicyclobacillus sacchari]GMA55596.1 long-chain-fatty-acid--CoA ligase [Alicyclobacillus sacchari]